MQARGLPDPVLAPEADVAAELPASASGPPGGARDLDGARGLGLHGRVHTLRELIARPLTPYYLILGLTALLLMLGLVMVLSTGSIRDLTDGESPYSDFIHQLIGVVVGLPIMWLAARSSPRVFRAAAYPLLAIS